MCLVDIFLQDRVYSPKYDSDCIMSM